VTRRKISKATRADADGLLGEPDAAPVAPVADKAKP